MDDTPRTWLDHLMALDSAARTGELAAHRDAITRQLIDVWRHKIDLVKYDQPRRALDMADLALQAAEIAGWDDCRGSALWAKAHALMMLGRFKEGLDCCDQARALFIGLGERGSALGVEVSRVFAIGKLSDEGGWRAALALAEAIRPELMQLGDEESLARLDMSVGYAWHCLNRYETALEAYERSYRIWSARGDRLQLARTRLNQCITFEAFGRLEEALAGYMEARQALTEIGKTTDAARADLSIGCTYRLQGNYDKALLAFAAAYEGFARDRNEVEMAECRLYESELLLDLNRPTEVIWRCEQSRPIFEREEIAEDLLLGNLLLARSYARRNQAGDGRRAEALLRDSAGRFEAAGAQASAAMVRLHLTDLLRSQGRNDEALSLALETMEVFKRHGQPVECAWAQVAAGFAFLGLRQYQEAETCFTEALVVAEQQRLPQLAFRCQYGLSLVAEARGDLDGAWQAQSAALQDIEALRGLLPPDDDLRSDFFDDKIEVFRNAVRLSLGRGSDAQDELFSVIERAKSRTLLEMLLRTQVEVGLDAADEETADLRRRLQEVKQRWQAHRSTRSYGTLRESDVAEDPLRSGPMEVDDSELQYQILELQRRLSLSSKGRQQGLFQGAITFDLHQVQAHLADGTVLLDYFAAGPQWIVLAVDNRRCTCHPLSVPGERILSLCHQIDRSIAKRHVHPDFWLTMVLRDLRGLYEALIAPLEGRLRGFERLVIIPDAQLHHVPFHALCGQQRYLIEDYEVSYAPSATILAVSLGRPHTAGNKSVLLAFPGRDRSLPHTVSEVREIASLLPDAAVFLEEEATRPVLSSTSGPLQALHLATHGTVCYDNPMFSSLAFADGDLAVWEVYGSRLPASLAILSACVTGRGVSRGTDQIGLTSAFLCAGSRALISTLWPIHDASTATFMRLLYHHLLHGAACGAALRLAQMELMQTERYRHPYYWAPFILSGAYNVAF